ncbi:hypothetical protein ACQBAU_11075 [Propionibacteriaceae bacterium Y2011]|uniref:hypothetical protein n=1 Tax=Microlunatus sp. Y2014 TaxID=3418488 RepID=UPI003B4DDD96
MTGSLGGVTGSLGGVTGSVGGVTDSPGGVTDSLGGSVAPFWPDGRSPCGASNGRVGDGSYGVCVGYCP